MGTTFPVLTTHIRRCQNVSSISSSVLVFLVSIPWICFPYVSENACLIANSHRHQRPSYAFAGMVPWSLVDPLRKQWGRSVTTTTFPLIFILLQKCGPNKRNYNVKPLVKFKPTWRVQIRCILIAKFLSVGSRPRGRQDRHSYRIISKNMQPMA